MLTTELIGNCGVCVCVRVCVCVCGCVCSGCGGGTAASRRRSWLRSWRESWRVPLKRHWAPSREASWWSLQCRLRRSARNSCTMKSVTWVNSTSSEATNCTRWSSRNDTSTLKCRWQTTHLSPKYTHLWPTYRWPVMATHLSPVYRLLWPKYKWPLDSPVTLIQATTHLWPTYRSDHSLACDLKWFANLMNWNVSETGCPWRRNYSPVVFSKIIIE